jgi:hypothetical protein
MTFRIFCLITLISTSVYSQDTLSLENTIGKLKETYFNTQIDTNLCRLYYQVAVKDIKRSNIALSYPLIPDSLYLQETFWKLCYHDYGILENRTWFNEDSIIFSDDEPKEAQCLELTTQQYIERKYGKNFITRLKLKADSLDKSKSGYIFPDFETKKDVLKIIQKKSKYPIDRQKYFDSKNSMIVNIEVSGEGEIVSIQCMPAIHSVFVWPLPDDNIYVIEAKRIIRTLGKIKPAQFRGKATTGVFSVPFSFTE